MHIDPVSTIIFNTLGSLLMSAGLFAVSHGYLGEIKGLKRWAVGLLLQAIGWIFVIFSEKYPVLFTLGLGSVFALLSLAAQYSQLTIK